MDVGVDVFGTVNLDDPVYSGEIDTTGGDVCAEQDGLLFLDKLEVDGCPFVLILLPV